MTENMSPLAVQNAPLLRALKAASAASPMELAEMAGILPNHVHRKLESLEAEGLIIREAGSPKHVGALTDAALKALDALDYYDGRLDPTLDRRGDDAVEIPLDLIDPWPLNPRTQFDPSRAEEMALSIADKGVLQPITVRPKGDRYEVVIGEQRRRGAVLAVERGYKPADFTMPAQVRDLTDDEALEVAGVENLQREDMHWMDEAKWYLRLASRLSGSQIERLVGGARKKRSIQDYIKCARELAPELIDRTYLPETNADYLSYVKARDLTGEKKERPALDLSPKLTIAFLEIIDAGLRQTATIVDRVGQVVVTRYEKPPVGGPLATLSADRKLTTFGFDLRKVVSRTTITDDVMRWLKQQRFDVDPRGALYNARAAIVGELQANRLQLDGAYLTGELNADPVAVPAPTVDVPAPFTPPPSLPGLEQSDDDEDDSDDEDVSPTVHQVEDLGEGSEPLPPSQRRVLREIAARSIHRTRVADDWVAAEATALSDPDFLSLYDRAFVTRSERNGGLTVALTLAGRDYLRANDLVPEPKSANSCTTPWLRKDQDEDAQPEYLRRLAGAAGTPAPTSITPSAQQKPPLPPMLAIVVVEVAHRISEAGLERGPGTWGVPILADYYKDTRGSQLVQQHKMLAFLAQGEKTLVALTKAAREWLAEAHGVTFDAAERPTLSDDQLQNAQAALTGRISPDAIYSTPWLNPPATPEAVTDPEPPAPVARQLSEFERAAQQLDAAARQLAEFVGGLPGRSKPPKREEVATLVDLVNAARERLAAHLPAAV